MKKKMHNMEGCTRILFYENICYWQTFFPSQEIVLRVQPICFFMQVLSIRLFLISARENLLFCSDKVQSTVTTFLHFMEPLYCCVNNFPVLYTSLISLIKGRFIRLICCNVQSVVHNIGMDFKLFCMLAHVLTF